MATIVEFEGKTPQIHESVFVASTAVIIGDVVLEEGVSVWYGAVLRGDSGIIRIGKETNALVSLPMRIMPESPRKTAPYQTLTPSSRTTSPIITAVDATNTDS